MPLPTTHPSHPAAPEILITLKDAQKGYADMRGVWAKKCLEMQGKRVVDRADTIDGVAAGKEFGRWVELVLSVADVCLFCLLSHWLYSPEHRESHRTSISFFYS
jgi:exocyst complex protein 7